MVQVKTLRKFAYSPLRYPGGKSSLFGFFCNIFDKNNWTDFTYIEPYAGGAGSALALLLTGKVGSIIINDYDVAIYSFWKAIIDHPADFISKIRNTPITIEEWRKQKEIYNNKDKRKSFNLGFATFYLNRTNRSGVLNAGPIGGLSQSGAWTLAVRYDKEKMINKIKLISDFKNKIKVTNKDGLSILKKYCDKANVFFYIDPPYYKKGALLYLNSFTHDKHLELSEFLNGNDKAKWILSYDDVPEIRSMYISYGRRFESYNLRYSVHRNTRLGSELVIYSDDILI